MCSRSVIAPKMELFHKRHTCCTQAPQPQSRLECLLGEQAFSSQYNTAVLSATCTSSLHVPCFREPA
jgi:hypothetical protein